MASPARRAAWEVLTAFLVAGPARGRLGSPKRPFPPPGLPPRDRALARKLLEGCVRRLGTLEAVLRMLSGGRRPRPPGLHAALLLGAFECLFDRAVPARAAVHESVELSRKAAGEGGARFANALLRRLAEAPDPGAWLGEPGKDPEHLALWHSHPRILVERWLAAFGLERSLQLFRAGNREPHLTLRTQTLRIRPEDLRARLLDEGITCRPGFHPKSLVLDPVEGGALLGTPAFHQGLFSIQDSTQTEILDLCEALPGRRILDFCAAPGGKATGLAEIAEDRAEILAWDLRPVRLAGLPGECRRLGLTSVRPLFSRDELDAEVRKGPFDTVLVDAPCTNTGVLARRPEARWRFREDKLLELRGTQEKILREAAPLVGPGGILVYSTCSIEAEENEDLAQEIAGDLGLHLVSAERLLPEAGLRDGGGVAVFRKVPGGP